MCSRARNVLLRVYNGSNQMSPPEEDVNVWKYVSIDRSWKIMHFLPLHVCPTSCFGPFFPRGQRVGAKGSPSPVCSCS